MGNLPQPAYTDAVKAQAASNTLARLARRAADFTARGEVPPEALRAEIAEVRAERDHYRGKAAS